MVMRKEERTHGKQKHAMVTRIMDASLLLRVHWHTFGTTRAKQSGCQPTIKGMLVHISDQMTLTLMWLCDDASDVYVSYLSAL